jgi:hypothetical protein
MKFSKRDVKIFVLGVITAFLIVFLWDMNENISDFKKGFNGGYESGTSR